MAYDDPAYTMRRERGVNNVAGAASATMTKFMCFQAAKLKAMHALVCTAGTNTDAGIDIYVGTASVGAITVGTNTAGTIHHSGLIDAAVPQNSLVEVKGKATSATMVLSLSMEYEVDPSATET